MARDNSAAKWPPEELVEETPGNPAAKRGRAREIFFFLAQLTPRDKNNLLRDLVTSYATIEKKARKSTLLS